MWNFLNSLLLIDFLLRISEGGTSPETCQHDDIEDQDEDGGEGKGTDEKADVKSTEAVSFFVEAAVWV